VLLADVIDNDSWRLWPHGDARLMKDKELYRQMPSVTEEGLATLIKNFTWVADRVVCLVPRPTCRVSFMVSI
jgi:phosphoribosylaminoimidazole carboxylase/phosphoribosylaminoimidazole-succinocarboxamide synthase